MSQLIALHIQDGRFQRSLALVTAGSSLVSGLEVVQREEDSPLSDSTSVPHTSWKRRIHEGRFQKHLAGVAALWSLLSGFEAWYSHYKSRFRIWAQWTPIILTPHPIKCVCRRNSQQACRTALLARHLFPCVDRRHSRFRVSRPRDRSPAGRHKNLDVQRPVRAAHLRASLAWPHVLQTI
jgi:hypothetical protein